MQRTFPTEHVLMAVLGIGLFEPWNKADAVVNFLIPPAAEPDSYQRFRKSSATICQQVAALRALQPPDLEIYRSPYEAITHLQFWVDDQIERLGPTIQLEGPKL